MNIFFLNWKDTAHPRAGGAELLTQGIMKRLVSQGHTATLFCGKVLQRPAQEIKDGYTIIRRGSSATVYLHAVWQWWKYLRHQHFDIIIDQFHGIPFGAAWYVQSTPVITFIHEVAGSIWFKTLPPPLHWLGYYAERLCIRLYRKGRFITVSRSTQRELTALGITADNISIIPEAIELTPLPQLSRKESLPALIYVGRLTRMKRLEHLVESFVTAKQSIPELELWIVGRGDAAYTRHLQAQVHNREVEPSVQFTGYVNEHSKLQLLRKAWLYVNPSEKEGFGLGVIEAASQGTPSVAYNVAGLREAIIDRTTGLLVSQQHPSALARTIVSLLRNGPLYERLRQNAWHHSLSFTFDKAAAQFERVLRETSAH